tara:strand:+ start:11148 stop:11954 length:807 start_codon:yes stop_codon:yes gene_type:complete
MNDRPKVPFDSKDFFKFETAHFFMLTQLFPHEPDRIKVFNALKDIAEVSKANHKDSHAFMNDEMLIFGKSLGFLREKKLIDASDGLLVEPWDKATIWRKHILTWAGDHCVKLDGDFLEFGCYDGKGSMFINEYNELTKRNITFHLYDCFEAPPDSEAFPKHSKELYGEVKNFFKEKNNVKIIKGVLPDCIEIIPEKISWVHLDLNNAKAEIGVLKIIYDNIVSGGMIVLDDYGWIGYWEQYVEEKEFFESKGLSILELPTGQGLVIKP